MKKIVAVLGAMLVVTAYTAVNYKLEAGSAAPTRGTVEFPTDSTLTYTHDGSEIGPVMVLDSFQINATDTAGNVSADAWIFVKITPVDDQAPVITSDTLTCAEGGSVTWRPSVSDADTN